jgi:hypothetical protein
MKHTLVAVTIALVSFAAYEADGVASTSNTQQAVQMQNGQAQTTIPSDKSTASGTGSEGSNANPWSELSQGWRQGHFVESWSQLSQGWK